MSDAEKQKNKKPPDTDITVTILGSGTCVPSLRRSACAVLMQTQGAKLLFDCGPGTMRRLLEAGVTIFDISFVFLSHFHPDHSGELASFLFSSKYPDGNRRDAPLTIIGGRGISNFYEGLKGAYGHWISLSPEQFNIIELDNLGNDGRSFGDFTLESAPMVHNPESLAYKITSSDGMSVVYSGDTDVSENLVTLARGADILICESALPDALKVSGHVTPSLAGEIASRAKVGKLVLTHFYPECDAADIEAECRKTYSGPLLLAEDLEMIMKNEE